ADGALKDRGNYELYDDEVLGPFPADWFTRQGRVVLTGEYGGKAGFRHVLDGLGLEVADGEEDLVFSLVQRCASATGKPLTEDEPGVTQQVGQTVQQAAEQAWARASHAPEGGAGGRQSTRQARSG